MKIQIIPCLKDNYAYLIIDEKKNDACVIDPSEANPIIKYLENNKIKLKGVHLPIHKEIYLPILKELEDYGIVFKEREVQPVLYS